jgi:Uma2 family endonuclease
MSKKRWREAAMAVRDTALRKLTYEDYLLFPEDGLRHEIIDGEHYVSPAPTPKHQRTSMRLSSRLHVFTEEHRLGEVFAAPIDVLFSRHDVIQPDLIFISNERAAILKDKNVQGAPDLVIEILSGSTRHLDERLKLDRYEQLGVSEYWIADPVAERIRVFRVEDQGFRQVAELSAAVGDVLTAPLLPGLEIPLREIFR